MIREQDLAGEPLSLDGLQELALPPEISMTPEAVGWTVVGGTVLVALVALVALLLVRRRALRYRRAALAELDHLRVAQRHSELPALLKRTALARHSRAEVAGLAGDEWTRFLDRTGGGGRFAAGAGRALAELSYGDGAVDSPSELMDAAEAWIRAQGPAWEAPR